MFQDPGTSFVCITFVELMGSWCLEYNQDDTICISIVVPSVVEATLAETSQGLGVIPEVPEWTALLQPCQGFCRNLFLFMKSLSK